MTPRDLGLLSLVLLTSVAAAQPKGASMLQLTEKPLLEARSPLTSAFYVDDTGLRMMTRAARSDDNGRTWRAQSPEPDFDADLPENYRRSPYPGFVDPVTKRLLVVVFSMDREDIDRSVEDPAETASDSYIRYRVSEDGGETFLFDEPVIQEGDYDFKHPLEGLHLGKNAIFLGDQGCRPIRTRQGHIIVPTQMTILNDEGEPETFGSGWDYYHCLMLIGSWQDDGRLTWQVSEQIKADPARTVRGLYEPTLAEMPDGRILCVMRGSNGLGKDPQYELPSHKWYCVSDDGGFTWSKPEPWQYSNGESFHSPSSMSQLIPHSNGRYYWIGNTSPDNARGNAPRWPIVVGEVDAESMMLIEDTVITMDTRGPDDPEGLQLSNFHAFEDRETGDIVLPMQRWTPPDKYAYVQYRVAIHEPLQGAWERVVEHAAFSPRDTSEDAVFQGKMWISNAYHTGNVLVRDLWNSSDGETWTLVSDDTPYDGYSEMVVYDEKLWAIKESVWRSDDGVDWTQVLEETPFGARGYGEVVVHDGKMWQLGSGADVWWTTDGATWTCVTTDAPYGDRYGTAVAVYDGKMWLMGGAEKKGSDPPEKHYPAYTTHNDVWCSADGASWTQVSERAPWDERMWFVSQVYAGHLWIIGGFSNRTSENRPDAWYTSDGIQWQRLQPDAGWSPRHEPTPYVFDGSLWVVAGNSWPLMNDVWRLTIPGAD